MAFAAGRRMALVPGTARSSRRSPRERSRPRAKSSPRTRWPTAFGCVAQNPACSMASFTRRRPIVRTPDVGAVVYGRAATALCAPSHPGGDGPGGPAAADAIARLDRGGRRARYLLSDAAYLLKKPLVHGSIFRIEGQVTVFQPGRGCYRCLYPEPPPAGAIGESEQVGVLAALPGIIGTIQAAETIKLITQVGDGLVNRVLLHDAMAMTFQEVRYR